MNLDVRDLRFWIQEATRRRIDNFLQQIKAVRIGMARKEDYARIVKDLENQKNLVGISRAKIIKDSWDDLKLLQGSQKRRKKSRG